MRCRICGKELTKSSSILRGVGDICASKNNLFCNCNDDSNSNYTYRIIKIAGHKVALVIDNNKEGYRSVTNDIDFIALKLGVDKIIYRDSLESWDYWDSDIGFMTLAVNGVPTRDCDVALEVASARYFNVIGGLFNLK